MTNFQIERKRILLIEDYEDARELATLILEEYTLVCARTFDEGLRIAQEQSFDLFILDSRLPDGDGVDLCRAIREFDPDTPILFYSAAAFESDIKEALQAGAQDYIVKPIIPDELKKAVEQLVSVTS